MTFWRGLGYALGRGAGHAMAAFGLRKGRELVERFKRDDAPPTPPALPPAAVVILLALVTLGCAQLREFGIGFGKGVIDGAKDCLSNPNDCAPTPRPAPSIPLPPGRICAERDCDCWHDPANERDYDWAFIACPRPTPSPSSAPTSVPTRTPDIPVYTPTPHATAVPTATPAPRGACMTGPPNWIEPPAPEFAESTKPPCRRGERSIAHTNPTTGEHHTVCQIDWTCAAGTNGRSVAEGADSSMRFGHVTVTRDGFTCEALSRADGGTDEGCKPGKPYGDRYGRQTWDKRTVVTVEWEGKPEKWWVGACDPVKCPEATPAPPTPGPIPTPPTPRLPQPRDFAFRWANVSDHARAFKDLGGGTCSYESDGALRWGGTLASGEYYQNTADRDHWNCVVETCTPWPGQSPEDFAKMLADHRKTFELVGGDEWITPSGITVEARVVDGPALEVHKLKNPYQSEVKAPCGALITARGCLDAGAYSCPDAFRGERHESGELNEDGSPRHYSEYDCRPEHRRPIPGAGGCGQWKPPFEVR